MAFDAASEQRLSQWISGCVLAVGIASPVPKFLEETWIARLQPPLCLSGWSNPLKTKIRAARKESDRLASNRR
jgi:hypothetical protein